jgi:hypothetical protein
MACLHTRYLAVGLHVTVIYRPHREQEMKGEIRRTERPLNSNNKEDTQTVKRCHKPRKKS